MNDSNEPPDQKLIQQLQRELAECKEDLEEAEASHKRDIKWVEEDLQDWREANRRLELKIAELQSLLADNPPPQLVGLRSVLFKWAARYRSDKSLFPFKKATAQEIWEFVQNYYVGRNEMF